MKQFWVLFNKEIIEALRNFKLIWMPITFILLGVMEPITQHFLPQIIESMGELPEGAVIQFPTPSASDVFMMSLGQFDMLGVLVLVLASMGIIAGERKSGVAAMILVKPVSYFSYVTAKWLATLTLMWVSYFIGLLAAWYYIGLLFDFIEFSDMMLSFVIYGLWLSLVVTITIFYNSFLKSPGLVGFVSLATIIILNTVSGFLSEWLSWSPALLMSYAGQILIQEGTPDHMMPAVTLTVGLTTLLLLTSVLVFRKKELAN